MKNMVYIQSGGPTSVINTSLYGAIREAQRHPDEIDHIYGSQHGIEGLIDDDLIDKTAHIARTASTRSIDEVSHFVGWRDALVVVESEVEVPDGTCIDGVVQAMLVHEDAPIGVDVAREFAHEEMTEEGVEIEVTAPVVLHLVEVASDVVLL